MPSRRHAVTWNGKRVTGRRCSAKGRERYRSDFRSQEQKKGDEDESRSLVRLVGSFVCPVPVLGQCTCRDGTHRGRGARLVAPLYDALNQPAKKDVATLLETATSPNWQSCGANDQCAPRERVIAGIKSRGETIPDLKWEIKELIAAGNEVIVRGEASGTPVAPLYDVPPTGKGFKIMSIDIHTIEAGKIVRSHHIEDWAGAMRQVTRK
jgi:predicted ester cyclase